MAEGGVEGRARQGEPVQQYPRQEWLHSSWFTPRVDGRLPVSVKLSRYVEKCAGTTLVDKNMPNI